MPVAGVVLVLVVLVLAGRGLHCQVLSEESNDHHHDTIVVLSVSVDYYYMPYSAEVPLSGDSGSLRLPVTVTVPVPVGDSEAHSA